jgi:hypothetical protein
MKRFIFLAVAAGILSACVEADPKTAAQDKEWQDRTYRTGSNIPSKHTASQDGVTSVNKDDMDRIRNGSSGNTPSVPMPGPGASH